MVSRMLAFRCDCDDCGAHWEIRLCPRGHRYAAMLPGKTFVDEPTTSPGWEDRVYGSDLLAVPSRTDVGEWGFVCPVCGDLS